MDPIKQAIYTAFREINHRYETLHNQRIEVTNELERVSIAASEAEREKNRIEAAYRYLCGYDKDAPVTDELLNEGMKP